jgi:CBS domain-containing protein
MPTTTTAANIMTGDVITLHATDTLIAAARLMRDHNIGALPVVDDHNHLIGILTDRDIVIHGISRGFDPAKTAVDALGLQSVATIARENDLESIISLMTTRQIHRLPVVDDHGVLVGIISLANIAHHTNPETLGTITEHLTRPTQPTY